MEVDGRMIPFIDVGGRLIKINFSKEEARNIVVELSPMKCIVATYEG